MKAITWIATLMMVLTIVQPAEARRTNRNKKGAIAATSLPAAAVRKPAAAPESEAAPSKPAAPARTPEVQAVVVVMAEQQKQIQDLREEIQRLAQGMGQTEAARQQAEQTSKEAQARATAAEVASEQSKGTVAKLDKDVAELKAELAKASTASKEEEKRLASAEGILSRFRFSGDVRMRYENFLQSYEGCDTCDMRNRARLRLRFGVESKLNEDFTSGFYLATGSFTDPISTNETLGSLFGRKTIGLDRAWISFQPKNHKWLQLTAGKWAYTWARTPLTFDNDLNPEGFSEKFSFDLKNGVVKNVTFVGTQLMFNEVASGSDSYALGGQFGSRLQLGKRLTLAPSVSVLSWTRPDAIAKGLAGKTITGNVNTNATTPDGKGYLSGFFYADYILDASVRTPWERFPVRFLLDYEKNMRAANSHDTAYWGEFTFGQTKNRNDVQFLYSYAVIEQDAVLAAFNESDLRAPTNVRQNRFSFLWQIQKNTTASYTLWLGRTLDPSLQNTSTAPGNSPGQEDPFLKRMQFDLLYKF